MKLKERWHKIAATRWFGVVVVLLLLGNLAGFFLVGVDIIRCVGVAGSLVALLGHLTYRQ